MADPHEVIDGARLVRELRLGERQAEGPLAVFPLFANGHGEVGGGEDAAPRRRRPHYITLRQALAEGRAVITEVSEGGFMPTSWSRTSRDLTVLLLDGEELAGAKQNRILNTSILVLAGTSIVVP